MARFYQYISRTRHLVLAGLLFFSQLTFINLTSFGSADAADTGLMTSTTAQSGGWGVNNTALVSSSDNTYAYYTPGDSSVAQLYSDFNISVPAGSTIDGVEVLTEAMSSNQTSDGIPCRLWVTVSWDGGTSWTGNVYHELSATDQFYTTGGSANTLGRTWTANEFSNSNFVVRVADNDPGVGCDNEAITYLDHLGVRVYYTEPITGPITGSITIIKDAQPNSLQNFDFTASLNGGANNQNFTLDDDTGVDGADDEYANQIIFNELSPGVHSFSESANEDWEIDSINCTGTNGVNVDLENRSVSITLLTGENVVCTFINTPTEKPVPQAASVTLVKDTNGTETEDEFTFYLDEVAYHTVGADSVVIDDIAPGTYSLTELDAEGWWLDWIYCGSQPIEWLFDDEGIYGVRITIEAGSQFTCTFYNVPETSAGGYKFDDLNGNGYWDKDEPTIEGWEINLYSPCRSEVEIAEEGRGRECVDELLATVTTDENGYYQFDGLTNDNYMICETQQVGWTQTYPSGYFWDESERWRSEDGCYFIYPYGEPEYDLNFGNFKLGEINGLEFHDRNKNGVQDTGEEPLGGWEISLYKLEAPASEDSFTIFSLLDPSAVPIASTITDTNGTYSFINLQAGDYQACQTPKSGWTRTLPATGECHDLSITASGQVVTPVNFGNWTPEITIVQGTTTLSNTGTPAYITIVAAAGILIATAISTISTRRNPVPVVKK